MSPDADIIDLGDSEICRQIEALTSRMMSFWKNPNQHASEEWHAPSEATWLLSKSMLASQTSLAICLRSWLDASTDGQLILAWANLGALVEGQIKLFLSVYYEDYKQDADAIQKKGKLVDPDACMLEELRRFCVNKQIWDNGTDWNSWIEHIRDRRNAIHAFKFREIGTFAEWKNDLKLYLAFIRDMDDRLPYP